MLFFVAVKYMPLADTIAVFFIEPMLLLALSAVFLGDHVGWPRRIASAIGFCGALLVVQPSYELFGPVALLPLLAALMFAFYLLITRRFGAGEHPVTMQLWSATGGMITIGLCILIGELAGAQDYRLTMPDLTEEIALIAVMGLISTVAHITIVIAYQLAPASVLAPFSYLEIVTATIFGYLVFNDFPGGLQWIGILIIVSTGLFIFFRERQLELRPAPVGDARATSLVDLDDA
jgi:drug/metabolite transporter (DMT)-like permease